MHAAVPSAAASSIVRDLQQRIGRMERRTCVRGEGVVSSGFAALDGVLPCGGLRRGTLAEWLADGPGCGAGLLALAAAREACRAGGALVVVDRLRRFRPWPAFALGMSAEEMVVVRPADRKDEEWAIDQALRCSAVGGVIAWPERLDGRTFRRLQLAAEAGGSLGCFVRPWGARGDPSWAEVRLAVAPRAGRRGWRLRIEALRTGGVGQGSAVEVELDERRVDETHPLPLAEELADPAASAGAGGFRGAAGLHRAGAG